MPLLDYLDEEFLRRRRNNEQYNLGNIPVGNSLARLARERRVAANESKEQFLTSAGNAMRTAQRADNLFKQGVCTAGIIARNPNAWDIPFKVGTPKSSDHSTSTRRAIAFASAGSILSPNQDDRGSIRGAFRHVLWRSDIVPKYSDSIARDIGNCHELNRPFNPEWTLFSSFDEADSAVDQFNNITGRQIGREFGNLTTKQRALKILDKAYTEGLHTVEKTPYGNYKVVKSRIDLDTYKKMYVQLLSLDEDGLPRTP